MVPGGESVFIGDEDCLHLNVYQPTVRVVASSSSSSLSSLSTSSSSSLSSSSVGFAPVTSDVLLPVMVWIHGGGLLAGNGNKHTYGPQFLMDEDVVMVSINYRLGYLGFLSLDTPEVSGNQGLRDCLLYTSPSPRD